MIWKYRKGLKKLSQSLRKKMTEAEKVLWLKIRRKQLKNCQFYRQRPLGKYIVDFFAPKAKIVIEVDGGQHYEKRGIKKDEIRDKYLRNLGLKVLRFSDKEVLKNIEGVIKRIYYEILPNPPL